ncbi:TrlF family AAA-like ATPase [Rhizobium leguminosarum]|uniref:TrlF family AAA-like ATPase n=1 Tax=Rhizobium leguminosarum TaxID=384 RepID=UPI0035E45381
MHAKGRHPGAVWKKTDFQVHTPRDSMWRGSGPLPGGLAEAEAARDEWADVFVEQCLQKEIDAVAITDHHDVVMYPYVERAILRSDKARGSLWLFPGVEITCQDAVQCLILFDEGTGHAVTKRIFGKMPKIAEPDADLGRAPQAEVCGVEIDEFVRLATEDVEFKGRSIVLPHANKGAHKDILRQGFNLRFADLEVDGVYAERHYSRLDAATLSKVYGETPDWGARRRGILTTGDNRSSSYEELGSNPCWVRLGEPTAEAVRQAVLADQARIAYEPPTIPSQRVLELRVSSSLTGSLMAVTFNDGFNALIGGRGSGKSALLEYLRFGLGRSTLDMDEGQTSERERALVRTTLVGGYVEVDLERDGVRETWRRTLDQGATISIRTAAGTTELPVPDVQERFRSRAFSQQQLSTLVRKAETADEQITGIAAAESVDQRREIERNIEEHERAVRLAFQGLVQAWAAQASHNRDLARLADLRARLEATRARLEAGGLSEEQQKVLDQHQVYSRTSALFAGTLTEIKERHASLDDLPLWDEEDWEQAVDIPAVAGAKEAMRKSEAAIGKSLAALKEEFASLVENMTRQQEEFEQAHVLFGSLYDKAHAAQEHLSAVVSDYRRLSAEAERAESAVRSRQADSGKVAAAEVILKERRNGLSDEVASLRRILSRSSERVEAMSNGTLRARVEEEVTPHRRFSALMELCEKCSFRELEQRCSSRVTETNASGGSEWEALVQTLLDIRHALVKAGDGSEIDPALIGKMRIALGWEATENQAKAVLTRLDDARLGELLCAWSSPFVRFEYKDRGSYMPFERASPGQQASALLTLLLEQEAGTLIIDQPEDDLDNKIIMKIARLLQKTKRKRQLIFATHNPNFVVNGDADKVIALMPSVEPDSPADSEAARIEIEADGAIETPSVRTTITDTMEGGRDAFELRGRKYAF